MHNCPVCDQACYCGGDIDDIDAGDEEALDACNHCEDEGDFSDEEFDSSGCLSDANGLDSPKL